MFAELTNSDCGYDKNYVKVEWHRAVRTFSRFDINNSNVSLWFMITNKAWKYVTRNHSFYDEWGDEQTFSHTLKV